MIIKYRGRLNSIKKQEILFYNHIHLLKDNPFQYNRITMLNQSNNLYNRKKKYSLKIWIANLLQEQVYILEIYK